MPRKQTQSKAPKIPILLTFLATLLLGVGLAWAAIPPRQIPSLSAIVDVGQMIRGQGLSRRGYVVDVRSRRAFPPGNATPNPRLVSNMMATLIMQLTNRPNGQAAWGTWFGPGDKVGILVDAAGSPATRVQSTTVAAVVGGLRIAGVKSNDIIVWSKNGQDLVSAGLPLNWSNNGVRFVGANQLPFDGSTSFKMNSGFFGRSLPVTSLLASCRYIINIATLEDHPVLGFRLALANQVLGSFKNSEQFERHWGGAVGIGEIATWKIFRQKFILHIIDGLRGTYNGEAASWHAQVYLGSTDPVALDRVASGLIDMTRRRTGVNQISNSRRAPRYIDVAAMNNAGEGNAEKITHKIVQVP
ncbi:MAG: DUF362 domain-containing protein [Myxococcales bacterium]|nr:DUF362 domain-containing protein [Myxococcales bacterium]